MLKLCECARIHALVCACVGKEHALGSASGCMTNLICTYLNVHTQVLSIFALCLCLSVSSMYCYAAENVEEITISVLQD